VRLKSRLACICNAEKHNGVPREENYRISSGTRMFCTLTQKKHLLLKPFYALVSLDAVSGGVLWCRILEHSRTLQLDHDGLREQ
jgi:hypothetical protein